MMIRKTIMRGAPAALFLAAFAVFALFPSAPALAEGYHTVAVIDYPFQLRDSDASLTFALNTSISYRLEALPDTSLVPESDLEMYLQQSDIEDLWSMSKTAARKFARASNADLIILGRLSLSAPGAVSAEFRVIYLALDETVRTSRITFKIPAGDTANLQKKAFERLASKLPFSVPAAFWKTQRITRSAKAFDWFGEGLRHIAARRDEAGLTAFEKALAAEPDSRDIHFYIGRYYATRQFNYERALFHLNAVLKKNPSEAAAHYWLGFTFYLKADYPSAIREFEKAKSIDEHSMETLLLLGTLYEESGNYSSAASNYREALKLAPQRAAVWYSLASALAVMGKPDEAIIALQRTLELDRKSFYDMARTDADLSSLRRTPAFNKLLESFKP
ncbi:MAG: tetratricopeptide repeat protein [bacterium]